MTDLIRDLILYWQDNPAETYQSWFLLDECLKNVGSNALTGEKVKLERWKEYLSIRSGTLKLNGSYRSLLSNDLGGPLFDLGSGRYSTPTLNDDKTARNFRAGS